MNIRKIKTWLRQNDFESNVKKDPFFYYDTNADCIFVSDEFNQCDHLDNYMKYIRHLGYKGNLNPRTISFLHELGHAETIDDLPDVDYYIDKLRYILETPCINMFTLNLKSNIYYRLPVERKATKWALEFINDFPEEVYELDKLFI